MSAQCHAMNEFKSKGGPARLGNAMRYSWAGLRHAWRHEAAFRQELCLVVPLAAAALFADVTRTERALVIAGLVLILIVEILNSALEATLDRVGSEHHELTGRAKDLGSAAVFVTIALALGLWGALIGVPLLRQWFG
jgi:diacylglycerol kinase (ATP)